MVKYTYLVMLVACVFFIFWKGRFEERIVAGALLVGSILTAFVTQPGRATGSIRMSHCSPTKRWLQQSY